MDTAASADSPRKSPRRTGLILPTTYDRLPEDRYFTIEIGWIVPALLKRVPIAGRVLEPSAGRGHIVRELRRRGIGTPRDLDTLPSLAGFAWCITNPPFTHLDERVGRLLRLCVADSCNLALLLRMEWIAPAKRGALIHDHPHFAGTIILTARPRWIEDPDGESPRHHFIWAVWAVAARPANARPWIVFEGRASCSAGEIGRGESPQFMAEAARAPMKPKPNPQDSEIPARDGARATTAGGPFSFTIAEVADEGLIAAKRIGRNPDGSLWNAHDALAARLMRKSTIGFDALKQFLKGVHAPVQSCAPSSEIAVHA